MKKGLSLTPSLHVTIKFMPLLFYDFGNGLQSVMNTVVFPFQSQQLYFSVLFHLFLQRIASLSLFKFVTNGDTWLHKRNEPEAAITLG